MLTSKKASGLSMAAFVFSGFLVLPFSTRQQPNEQSVVPVTPSVVARQEGNEPVDETQLFMRAKLGQSQKVLEGLVTEDFDMISKASAQMKKISLAAHWPTTIDEVYQHYGYEFRRQCDKLVEQSERKDLQAAHYTFLHLSTTCIDCHDYVRERFRVERPIDGGPVQLIPTQWDGPVKKRPSELDPPQPDDSDSGAKHG